MEVIDSLLLVKHSQSELLIPDTSSRTFSKYQNRTWLIHSSSYHCTHLHLGSEKTGTAVFARWDEYLNAVLNQPSVMKEETVDFFFFFNKLVPCSPPNFSFNLNSYAAIVNMHWRCQSK